MAVPVWQCDTLHLEKNSDVVQSAVILGRLPTQALLFRLII